MTKLSDMTIKNQRVCNTLYNYLCSVRGYNSVKTDTPFRVYLTGECDFIALEAVDKPIAFTSFSHKLSELSSSDTISVCVPFIELFNLIQRFSFYGVPEC